jgi:hypothetical protein
MIPLPLLHLSYHCNKAEEVCQQLFAYQLSDLFRTQLLNALSNAFCEGRVVDEQGVPAGLAVGVLRAMAHDEFMSAASDSRMTNLFHRFTIDWCVSVPTTIFSSSIGVHLSLFANKLRHRPVLDVRNVHRIDQIICNCDGIAYKIPGGTVNAIV